MSDDLVKRVDEALKDVTPGPWCVGPADDTTVSSFGYGDVSQTLGNYGSLSDLPRMEANARFIAAARELVPLMRDRIEADAKRIDGLIAAAEARNALLDDQDKLIAQLAQEARAAEARVKVMEDENKRLRLAVKLAKSTADEWAISRSIGSPKIEGDKADALWKAMRRLSAIADGPIQGAALEGEK